MVIASGAYDAGTVRARLGVRARVAHVYVNDPYRFQASMQLADDGMPLKEAPHEDCPGSTVRHTPLRGGNERTGRRTAPGRLSRACGGRHQAPQPEPRPGRGRP